jgi:hypothetical protein
MFGADKENSCNQRDHPFKTSRKVCRRNDVHPKTTLMLHGCINESAVLAVNEVCVLCGGQLEDGSYGNDFMAELCHNSHELQ